MVLLRYDDEKYSVLTKEERKKFKDEPFIFYKKSKKNYMPPVQKMNCDE